MCLVQAIHILLFQDRNKDTKKDVNYEPLTQHTAFQSTTQQLDAVSLHCTNHLQSQSSACHSAQENKKLTVNKFLK